MRRIKGISGNEAATVTIAALIVTAIVTAGVLTTGAASAQSPAGQVSESTPTAAPKKIVGFKIGPVMDGIKPDQFFIDPPTLENLGFRWYIEGDSNRNASVAVSYRQKGEDAWKQAQPMLRVHHEVVDQADGGYRTGNLFAGSVLGLQAATDYRKPARKPPALAGGCGCPLGDALRFDRSGAVEAAYLL